MTDQIPYIKSEICPTCKKPFVPAPEHRLKIGFVKYCKPSCVPEVVTKETKLKNIGCYRARAVVAYTLDGEYVGEYPTMAEAERQLDVYHGSIYKVCVGKQNYAGKYTFKFKEE